MAAAAALAPASASAGLIAAYEHYVPGQGFQIGLKNAQTGADLPVPAGVNTAEDELHPALSFDGRYLVFMRTRLLPNLNGDIPVPNERALIRVDRQTGALTTLRTGAVAGPAFTRAISPAGVLERHSLSNGVRVSGGEARPVVSEHRPLTADGAPGPAATIANRSTFDRPLIELVETTHAAVDGGSGATTGVDRMALTVATFDSGTGALRGSVAHLARSERPATAGGTGGSTSREVGSVGSPASHPVPRARENTVALAMVVSGNFDIHTTPGPGQLGNPPPAPAPAAINTSAAEQMPAWSPDDLKLGFVRTSGGRRLLGVFDATPGIQGVLNPPVDIGPEAPTRQTRDFQSVWGGLSLADDPSVGPGLRCDQLCLSRMRTLAFQPLVTRLTQIGIFVARVTGTRRLLGRSVPRLRPVGRVPLGVARRGRNLFRWDGRVGGRPLKPGTYLLTYRTLRGKRITNTSNSIRFTVTASGKIRNVRRQR